MTESEWLACADLHRLLEFLEGRASVRKLRLFSCACCRRIWGQLLESERAFIEAVERVVDGVGTARDADAIQELERNRHVAQTAAGNALACLFHGRRSRTPVKIQWLLFGYRPVDPPSQAASAEVASQCALLRDVVGDPFHTVAFSPAWRTDTAVLLARQMYEAREFGAMPILADALQDAGCDNETVLSHSRGGGLHTRGCWVVDLVLSQW